MPRTITVAVGPRLLPTLRAQAVRRTFSKTIAAPSVGVTTRFLAVDVETSSPWTRSFPCHASWMGLWPSSAMLVPLNLPESKWLPMGTRSMTTMIAICPSLLSLLSSLCSLSSLLSPLSSLLSSLLSHVSSLLPPRGHAALDTNLFASQRLSDCRRVRLHQ